MFTLCIVAMLLFVSFRLPGQTFQLLPSSRTGVNFRNDIRESDSINILLDFYIFNGGGVGIGDLDQDGLQDIVFTSSQQGVRLFKNLGDFRFVERSNQANLTRPDSIQNTGVVVADLNTDGLLDVYVCRRYAKNRVYINQGGGIFRDETDASPLAIKAYTTHAVQIDYDRDGDVDVFLVNSGEPRRNGYLNPGVSDMLLRNDGNGAYTDVSVKAGILDRGYGLSASVGDVDDDGWPDIYVANDFEERDKIWLNQRDGTFRETASERVPNMSWASMGSDVADINSDGLLDILTVDMLPRDNHRRQTQIGGMSIYGPFFDSLQRVHNTLQLNRGGGHFINVGYMAGIAATDWSWSVLAQDYDLDTDQDILITNGTKRDLGDQDFAYNFLSNPAAYRLDAYKSMPSTRLHNYFFVNRGKAGDNIGFDDGSISQGLSDSAITNGAAYADLDNDGDMDLVLNNTDTLAFLYRNTSIEQGSRRWSGIQLQGTERNVTGIGSRVVWSISSGKQQRKVLQECYATRGFQSTSDTRMVVALADDEIVDSLQIQWSDGMHQTIRRPVTMAYAAVFRSVEPNPARHPLRALQAASALLQPVSDSILPYRHRENLYDDFKRERLLPYRFSKDGPAMAVGDVNGDKLPDVVTAGSKYQPTQCFLQSNDGLFAAADCGLDDAIESEDIDLALIDIDNDRDLDLVVVTGGSEFDADDELLYDRVYRNNGKGMFTRLNEELMTTVAGSCLATHDFDADGDVDLFIGGRVVPGRFPEVSSSTLWRNVKGHFVDVTDSIAQGLRFAGMTSSAIWADVDGDKDQDLVVVGEWMSPRVWRNTRGKFTEATQELGLDSLQGWWSVVRATDVDADGDQDLMLGNVGVNCLFTPEPGKPLECYVADFDENGSLDPLVFRNVDGRLVPTRGRTTITAHMPTMTRTFTTYESYAKAGIDELITTEQRRSAVHLVAREFRSGVLRNSGGRFAFEPFPQIAQAAPIRDILPYDVDSDGDLDLIAVGNSRIADGDNIGFDAGMGLVMRNRGNGAYEPLLATESGFWVKREARRIVRIPRPGHTEMIGVTTNSSTPALFVRPVR